MRLRKLAKMLLITFSLLSLNSCKQDVPAHNPCLLDLDKCDSLANCECFSYKLVDKNKIEYQFDRMANLAEFNRGFALPAGQFEKIVEWAREEKKDCESQK